jgi:hypothetical protein
MYINACLVFVSVFVPISRCALIFLVVRIDLSLPHTGFVHHCSGVPLTMRSRFHGVRHERTSSRPQQRHRARNSMTFSPMMQATKNPWATRESVYEYDANQMWTCAGKHNLLLNNTALRMVVHF